SMILRGDREGECLVVEPEQVARPLPRSRADRGLDVGSEIAEQETAAQAVGTCPTHVESRRRSESASSTWSMPTFADPARSAQVRATLITLAQPRPLRPRSPCPAIRAERAGASSPASPSV